jgi:hypothetical protein
VFRSLRNARSLLVLAAVIVFLLAAFGVDVGGDVSLVPLGLALFAAGHLL